MFVTTDCQTKRFVLFDLIKYVCKQLTCLCKCLRERRERGLNLNMVQCGWLCLDNMVDWDRLAVTVVL